MLGGQCYLVDALCVGAQSLKTLSPNAEILSTPRLRCTNTTKFTINNVVDGTYQVVTHAGCICNEYIALRNRHLIDRTHIQFDAKYFKDATSMVYQEFSTPLIKPCGFWSIIRNYHGTKRNAYIRALDNIKTYGWSKNWAHIKMFVKPDKFPTDKAITKPPRAIQYRTPEFNLLLAHYLKPIEEWFYEQLSPGGFRFVAKGLDNVARALVLRDASSTFDNPAYILLDHSAFDSTINTDHIKACHKFYTKIMKSKALTKLLRCQLINRGFSKHGIHYRVKGTRMSGDFDTALGNTLVNYISLRSWLLMNKVRGEILLDGDDSIIVVERSNLSKLDIKHFEKCGFETKVEIVYDINNVEFCQAKYLPTEPPRFARNPIRALSRLNISVRNYHGRGYLRYQAGIGLGEMAVSNGVPILYYIGSKLSQLHHRPIFDTETSYKHLNRSTPVPVTDEVRVAFYEAWNITPHEQLVIESQYTPLIRSSAIELIQRFYALPENAEE